MIKRITGFLVIIAVFLASCSGVEQEKIVEEKTEKIEIIGEVNVYTHRNYDVDKILFEKFTQQSGIKVNVRKDKADKLITLLEDEGEQSLADVLIMNDAGRLYHAKQLNLLQVIGSSKIKNLIARDYRDNEDMWTSLSKRARVVVYSKSRVQPEELSSYTALTDKKWKGKIVLSAASNIYNQSLLASMISLHGEEQAMAWAKGMATNASHISTGNDKDLINEVALGNADLAIVNTDDLGRYLNANSKSEREMGEAIGIFFPKDDKGVHMNISGAGIARYAPHKENAVKLLEYLASEEAQILYASSNFEYPVNAYAKPVGLLKSWGGFSRQNIPFEALGKYNAKAVALYHKVDWK